MTVTVSASATKRTSGPLPYTPGLQRDYERPEATRAGRDRFRYVIQVASLRITRVESGTVQENAEGVAELDFKAGIDLSRYTNADVSVFLGYGETGDLTEWFTGRLDKPSYDPETRVTSAKAYGVSGMMNRRYYNEDTIYSFQTTFSDLFADIQKRIADSRVRINVRHGRELVALEEGKVAGQATLKEIANTVTEPAGYVQSDLPQWRYIVRPKPKPAAGIKARATFGPNDYAKGQPVIDPSEGGPWYKVVAFRKNDEGWEFIRAEHKINNPGPFKPAKNEIYWLQDFQGGQPEAEIAAAATAKALESNTFVGTLGEVEADPRLHRLANISVARREDPETGRRNVLAIYSCLINEIGIDLVTGKMGIAFDALKADERELTPPAIAVERRPIYVVNTSRPDYPFGMDSEGLFLRPGYDEDYIGTDAEGVYLQTSELDAPEAGEDTEGVWVTPV